MRLKRVETIVIVSPVVSFSVCVIVITIAIFVVRKRTKTLEKTDEKVTNNRESIASAQKSNRKIKIRFAHSVLLQITLQNHTHQEHRRSQDFLLWGGQTANHMQ